MRKGNVYYKNSLAGSIAENEDGYVFQYNDDFINLSFLSAAISKKYIELLETKHNNLFS